MLLNVKTRHEVFQKCGDAMIEVPLHPDEAQEAMATIMLAMGGGERSGHGDVDIVRWTSGLVVVSSKTTDEQWLILDYDHEPNGAELFGELRQTLCNEVSAG